MYILLIVIYLVTGPPMVRTSIVEGPTALKSCTEALPLSVHLHLEGKFFDDPPVKLIKDVKGSCVTFPDEIKVVRQ